MGKITLKNIKVYAYHGCLNEETIIGSEYLVNVTVWANLEKAKKSDHLADTVDYVHINAIVKKEMSVPSKLLEHVAQRIINRLFSELSAITKIKIAVAKINPPIGGDVENVSIQIQSKRSSI